MASDRRSDVPCASIVALNGRSDVPCASIVAWERPIRRLRRRFRDVVPGVWVYPGSRQDDGSAERVYPGSRQDDGSGRFCAPASIGVYPGCRRASLETGAWRLNGSPGLVFLPENGVFGPFRESRVSRRGCTPGASPTPAGASRVFRVRFLPPPATPWATTATPSAIRCTSTRCGAGPGARCVCWKRHPAPPECPRLCRRSIVVVLGSGTELEGV